MDKSVDKCGYPPIPCSTACKCLIPQREDLTGDYAAEIPRPLFMGLVAPPGSVVLSIDQAAQLAHQLERATSSAPNARGTRHPGGDPAAAARVENMGPRYVNWGGFPRKRVPK